MAETALELAKKMTWGTYGPGATEAYETQGTPLPLMVKKPLGDCDTDHLVAILAHIEERPNTYSGAVTIAVRLVLEDRERNKPNRRGAILAQKRAKVLERESEE